MIHPGNTAFVRVHYIDEATGTFIDPDEGTLRLVVQRHDKSVRFDELYPASDHITRTSLGHFVGDFVTDAVRLPVRGQVAWKGIWIASFGGEVLQLPPVAIYVGRPVVTV